MLDARACWPLQLQLGVSLNTFGDADALQIVAAQLKQSALEQGSQGYHYDMMCNGTTLCSTLVPAVGCCHCSPVAPWRSTSSRAKRMRCWRTLHGQSSMLMQRKRS